MAGSGSAALLLFIRGFMLLLLAQVPVALLVCDVVIRFYYRPDTLDTWFAVATAAAFISVTITHFREKRTPGVLGSAPIVFAALLCINAWADLRGFLFFAGQDFIPAPQFAIGVSLAVASLLAGLICVFAGILTVAKRHIGAKLLFWALPVLIFFRYASWLLLQDSSLDLLGELAIGGALYASLSDLLFREEFDESVDIAYVPGTKGVAAIGCDPILWRLSVVATYAWLAVLAVLAVNAYVGDVLTLCNIRHGEFSWVPRILATPLRAFVVLLPVCAVPCLIDLLMAGIRRMSKLRRTVILLHCGEREAVSFCGELEKLLGSALDGFTLAVVDGSLPLDLSATGATVPHHVFRYIKSFAISPRQYDRVRARPAQLLKTPVPVTVFCMGCDSYKSEKFRNMFVHHVDAAGVRPDVTAIPVLLGPTYEELKAAAADDHFVHTLRRAYVTFQHSEVTEVGAVIRSVLKDLAADSVEWRRERAGWLVARCLVGLSYVSHRVSTVALLPMFALCLLALGAGSLAETVILGSATAFIAAFLLGIRLADVPATPAFAEHRADTELKAGKRRRHLRALLLPGIVWLLVAFEYGTGLRHIGVFAAAFVLGAIEQRWRYLVFQLRLRLTGVENHAEHMGVRIVPVLARVAPDKVPQTLRFDDEEAWRALWDMYSMRVLPSVSRPFLPWWPRVFISYAWRQGDEREADELFAFRLADALKECGISHFLDRRELKRGLPWRSRIAIEISKASHFILVLSSRTAHGETCAREARQALACLPLASWPRIIVCALDPEEEILEAGGDDVFGYLLERAVRLDPEDVNDVNRLCAHLAMAVPESYLGEFRRLGVDLGFRSPLSTNNR